MLDEASSMQAWDLFGQGYIPHNVVLDHNGEVLFTNSGYQEDDIIEAIQLGLSYVPRDEDSDGVMDSVDNCFDIVNPDQLDIDQDGYGDACDPCDNANIFTSGNTNGTLTTGGQITVDIFDVLSLVEIVLTGQTESCGYEISDYTYDGDVNVIDVIALVQLILNGDFDNSLAPPPGDGLFEIQHSDLGDKAVLSSDGKISGFQFDTFTSEVSESDLNQISLPEGWDIDFYVNGDNMKVLAYDASGNNPTEQIEIELPSVTSSSFENVIVASPGAGEILINFSEREEFDVSSPLPGNPKIQKLYPNPFNPSLSISFSIPNDEITRVAIYNTIGEQVEVVRESEMLSAGNYTLFWNAASHPSGMYIVQIQTKSFTDARKALLVK